MSQQNNIKYERILIQAIADNWGIGIRAARDYLYAFKNQKTK